MLYFVLILCAVIAATFIVTALLPLPMREFHLSSSLDPEETERGIRELAASSRAYAYGGEKPDLRLIKRYIEAAERIVEAKIKNGEACSDYEMRFSQSYHVISDAYYYVKKCASGFSSLSAVNNRIALYDFACYVVRYYGGRISAETLETFVGIYNSSRPLTWAEVCNLKPMLRIALLEQFTVYASKIIKRRELYERALKDAAFGHFEREYLKFDSYVRTLWEACDERQRAGLSRQFAEYGVDAERAAAADDRRLASYNGGMTAAIDSLRADFFTTEYLLSLSPSAIYLESEPNVNFSKLTPHSKARYLSAICSVAKKRGVKELDRTRQVVALARVSGRDIAEFVVKPPLGARDFALHVIFAVALAAACSLFVAFFAAASVAPGWKIAVGILSFPVFLTAANGLYLFLLGKLTKTRFVPEYAVGDDAPQVAIICCHAIKNAEDVRDAVRNLETVAYANPQSCFSYGLLLDTLGDYPTAGEDISRCIGQIKNSRRFFVCLRKTAWERKRGALLQFNSLVLRGEAEPFRAVWGEIKPFEYVITLDADSMLLDAERLVGIMLHPYNADKTIMNLGMRAKVSALATPFARLMCGDAGLTRYDSSGCDTVWNAYGFGNYTGKGIYRTARFNALLENAFPDGRVLSHDIIEGAFAGCGNSGVCGIDEFPLDVSSYMSRLERWMRGDIQLLPWLKSKVRNRDGEKVRSPVSAVAKWQILLNAVGVLAPVCALALLVFMPITGLFSLLAVAFAPQLMRIILAFNIGITRPARVFAEQLRQLWWIMLVPTLGLVCLGAICVTAARMIRKKNLLNWKTYASSSGIGSIFVGNLLLASYYIAYGAIGFHLPYFIIAAAILLIVPVDFLLSLRDVPPRPTDKEKAELLELARVTWLYFEETLTAKNGWLPCDNFQEDKGWAERTSPTNIGMAISSAVCASEIGLISETRRDELVGKMLAALSALETYEGCPYNWYETGSGRPLEPRYVSSVDCGNLLAALLMVSAVGGDNAKIADELVGKMNIGFMYDGGRGLLRIGYNVSTAEFDAGHYDLLGSEAALTYLVCAGCGKLPQAAFARLSRRSFKFGKNALASWTGGMFEYMLPLTYFKTSSQTLLGKNARAVAEIHRRFAESACSDVYGMSESLYGDTNDNGDYAYRAFGVYGIALTTERQRKVFAPYAAAMALCADMRGNNGLEILLEKYCGAFGLYDSVDLTSNTVQKATMTHHQGMIMLSLCNRLCGDAVRNTAYNDARIRAAAILLEETPDAIKHAKKKLTATEAKPSLRITRTAAPRTELPQLNYITNGEYFLVTNECGRNYQLCREMLLTRFDRLSGMRVFAEIDGEVIEPTARSVCRYDAFSSQYSYENAGVLIDVKASVVFDKNAEFRTINVKNSTNKTITMPVIVAAKPCLTARDTDLSHKAFSSMFIETAFDEHRKLVSARRSNDDNGNLLAMFADTDGEYAGDERYLRTEKGARFGRTTEPVLAFKKDMTLQAGECAVFTVYLAYGTREEINVCRRKSADPAAAETSAAQLSSMSSRYMLPREFRDLGSYLLFAKGRSNGALPCVTVAAKGADVGRAVDAIAKLKLLHKFGAAFSLIVFYDEPVSYFTQLADKINASVADSGFACRIINELTADPREIEELKANGVDVFSVVNRVLPPFYELPPHAHRNVKLPRERIEMPLGIGGFTASGEYCFAEPTPSPWYNVMSDGKIGCLVSDRGGFTFAANSRQEKLTRHSNDELNDEHGDGIVLGEGGNLWSVTRAPVERDCDYTVLHGFGYSEFACGYNAAVCIQRVYVADGVKYYDLSIEDALGEEREIDVMCFAELVMGDHVSRTLGAIKCGELHNCLTAENGALKFFLSSDEPLTSKAYFAESYRDRSGAFRVCTDLENAGCTPALAYSVRVRVPPFGKKRVIFALSATDAATGAGKADAAFAAVNEKFARLTVAESDEKPLKYYLKWLSYQTLIARFTAKCGFQQVGGAVGFRDQLQDSLALLGICPERVRAHLIDCAEHQFEDGDVMHWWHPPAVGVRTRICDDRLFLPLALCEYVEYTGDSSVLYEKAYYLKDKPLPEHEQSIYAPMESGDLKETLLAHAVRAIRSVRLSPRGLVLMGSGDWNDGMDRIGERGNGESVWCTMFLYYVIGRLSQYVDEDTAHGFMRLKMKLYAAVRACFAGDRFIRAFDDDGNALGVEESAECKIDALAQSWAVLSGIATGEQAKTVLLTACERLVDHEHGVIRLLDPPFANYDAGYISEYPAGVRENGGQYTHAAVWLIWALYEADLADKANELLDMILPSSHTADKSGVETYLKEPYVLAGDVYAGALAGRAGWTWYTGAAGWLYRLLVEKYYGIKISADGVRITPNVPYGKEVSLKVRTDNGEFALTIDSRERGRWKTFVGGRGYEGSTLPLRSLVGKTIVVKRQKLD